MVLGVVCKLTLEAMSGVEARNTMGSQLNPTDTMGELRISTAGLPPMSEVTPIWQIAH